MYFVYLFLVFLLSIYLYHFYLPYFVYVDEDKFILIICILYTILYLAII